MTCRECEHWHELVTDQSVSVAQPGGGILEIPRLDAKPSTMGQCRERLHVAIQVMGRGQIGTLAVYPQTQADFPKCGQFKERENG